MAMNDLALRLNGAGGYAVGGTGGTHLGTLLYADDILLLDDSLGSSELRCRLTADWAEEWGGRTDAPSAHQIGRIVAVQKNIRNDRQRTLYIRHSSNRESPVVVPPFRMSVCRPGTLYLVVRIGCRFTSRRNIFYTGSLPDIVAKRLPLPCICCEIQRNPNAERSR